MANTDTIKNTWGPGPFENLAAQDFAVDFIEQKASPEELIENSCLRFQTSLKKSQRFCAALAIYEMCNGNFRFGMQCPHLAEHVSETEYSVTNLEPVLKRRSAALSKTELADRWTRLGDSVFSVWAASFEDFPNIRKTKMPKPPSFSALSKELAPFGGSVYRLHSRKTEPGYLKFYVCLTINRITESQALSLLACGSVRWLNLEFEKQSDLQRAETSLKLLLRGWGEKLEALKLEVPLLGESVQLPASVISEFRHLRQLGKLDISHIVNPDALIQAACSSSVGLREFNCFHAKGMTAKSLIALKSLEQLESVFVHAPNLSSRSINSFIDNRPDVQCNF